jgi:ribosome biogenesis protein ERB1
MTSKLKKSKLPGQIITSFEPNLAWFSADLEETPLSICVEPKRRYIASAHEDKKVVKLVRAIRKGWINNTKNKTNDQNVYLLWSDSIAFDIKQETGVTFIPPLRQNLPGNKDSYNPPKEYLFTNKALASQWEENETWSPTYMTCIYKSLRLVPTYEKFIYEQFNRCLDRYLYPRSKKEHLNIDTREIVPKLPKPCDLEPFPKSISIIYTGHRGTVSSLCPDPSGQWLASGSMDGTVKLWEVNTGKCLRTWDFNSPSHQVVWCPLISKPIFAACSASEIHLLCPLEDCIDTNEFLKDILTKKYSYPQNPIVDHNPICSWHSCHYASWGMTIVHKQRVKHMAWHPLGDSFASVSPDDSSESVILHHVTRRASQLLFRSSHGRVVRILFHPTKSLLYLAYQYGILIYDFVEQIAVHKLNTYGSITSLAIHGTGDHFITGSEDKKVRWYNPKVSTKPYRVMRYHSTIVHSVAFHCKMPLFASSADDGTCQVFHCMVPQDPDSDPKLVPVSILRGHEMIDCHGVSDCVFHPNLPWIFTSGADGNCHLYCN